MIPNCFPSNCTKVEFHQPCVSSSCSPSSPAFVIASLCNFSYSGGCVVYFIVVLVFIFLITNKVDHFNMFTGHYNILFYEVPFSFIFLWGYLCFSFWPVRPLYLFWIESSVSLCGLQITSLALCLFPLSIFWWLKVLNFNVVQFICLFFHG